MAGEPQASASSLARRRLKVPYRKKKKRLTGIGVMVGDMRPIRPNVVWAMDFQFDQRAI